MRKEIDETLIKYQNKKIKFFFNDLWSFPSKDLKISTDLITCENIIWSEAYGAYLAGYLPIVYGVSFFNIGRLEQLRKFFGYNKAPIIIINAGAYGYDKYGWEHAFKDNDDIVLMKQLNFKIIDNFNMVSFNKILKKKLKNPNKKNIYIRLGKDRS